MISKEHYDSLPDVVRVKVDKFNTLTDAGMYPYASTKYVRTTTAKAITEDFESLNGQHVSIAGRVMAKRGQGKVSFWDLQDSDGRVQLFVKRDTMGEEEYKLAKTYDIGDIIGVEGEVFMTEKGQISVRTEKITLLSKSIQVLPEKYHGLKDIDTRYRQRYVDLIVNPEVKDVFIKRTQIIKAMREFMDNRGFLEVETPVLATLAGGASARPFITHHNTLDIPMYLRIATELPLKRLIVGGFDKVYEIGRIFRNEGMDATHNPEFTTMESYEAYADFNDVMEMVEEMFSYIANKVNGTDIVEYDGHEISLKAPFRRARMVDLVTEKTNVDFDKITDLEEARAKAKELNLHVEAGWGIGKIVEELFEMYVEDSLVQPTFVTHHPVEISPLAKKCADDERYTERFEVFIAGHEYGNAFSELNDPFDQRERFADQMKKKSEGDDEAHPYDTDFINALEVAMPPTGGLGVGVDRLVMLLTGQTTIRDVILFPTMKPLD
ncbi:MAG: lysine--tRNA ligase [Anaerofustis stercorihominis]|nr:lysine--tRNA ligase [Anaerofustis stercorihominis]